MSQLLDPASAYITLRHQHPAWQLLAARRAPLVLMCLKTLFQHSQTGIAQEDALQLLTDILASHANNDEFEINTDDYPALARRELREWIKRGLVVEREGELLATDALQRTLDFVDGLDRRLMTSTASRLATVQREIENLDARLNPDPKSRVGHLERKIRALTDELERVKRGEFTVLSGQPAIEGIREIYNLSMSLRADFRRVEDSYRTADRELRHSIINDNHHRGAIVDSLLDSHDNLLETPEGQVFDSFYEQLNRSVELDNMKQRVRNILRNPHIEQALNRQQQVELRWLIAQLVGESANIIRARARSERDVKAFLKTGLATEHHRVGELLRELLQVALDIDWGDATERRSSVPFPVVAVAVSGLPLIERLRCKSLESDDTIDLELSEQHTNLIDIEDDFWSAFDTLDRDQLLQDTLQVLSQQNKSMGIAELAGHLPPTHDLENLALWLTIAREADVPVHIEQENVDVIDREGKSVRFTVPKVELAAAALANIVWEI